MEEKLKGILAEVCGVEPEDITHDINFFEEGILDSFGVVRLLVMIEEQFGKTINIAEITRPDIENLDKLMTMVTA